MKQLLLSLRCGSSGWALATDNTRICRRPWAAPPAYATPSYLIAPQHVVHHQILLHREKSVVWNNAVTEPQDWAYPDNNGIPYYRSHGRAIQQSAEPYRETGASPTELTQNYHQRHLTKIRHSWGKDIWQDCGCQFSLTPKNVCGRLSDDLDHYCPASSTK